MKTGKYRLRRSWRGKAILQAQYDSPTLMGGSVDASIRSLNWYDVEFDDLEEIQVTFLKTIIPQE